MKHKLDAIRKDINEALSIVAEIHGLTFSLGSMSYGDNSFSVKLEAFETNGASQDFAQLNWNKQASLLGFEADDYGKTVNIRGGQFVICGIKLKNSKYPIIAHRLGSTTKYKFPSSDVIKALRDNSSAPVMFRPSIESLL